MEWLSDIFFATAFKFGGWHAVVVLAAVACSATIGILCFYLVRPTPSIFRCDRLDCDNGSSNVALSCETPRLFICNFVVCLMLMTTTTLIYRPCSLVDLMALWANLHGSFTLGLALLYVADIPFVKILCSAITPNVAPVDFSIGCHPLRS